MYISRVEIDVENRRKLKDLTHLGAYHSWVETSFPAEVAKQERHRKLWRIDKLHNKNYLIIVSTEQPSLPALEKYGVPGSGQTKPYDAYLANLQNGDRMRFRVTLNPTITLSAGSGKRGQTKPHVTAEYQLQYLVDRSRSNGFNINENEIAIVERGYGLFKKNNQRPIKLITVVYEGILTIEDVSAFRNTLTNGFGKHKAYGFGLMTVIPMAKE